MAGEDTDFGGTVMVGLDGAELTSADRRRLAQPAVGAVCLFSRNFQNVQQLARLIKDARKCVAKDLLFAVDHEGGKVQRFVARGFSRLKPARKLGELYERDPEGAISEARERGSTVSRQIGNVGIDLSFVPVLDVDHRRNEMIAERCFSSDSQAVAALGLAFCSGIAEYGGRTVGKHFPGHGWAKADSHFETPVDDRPLAAIVAEDVLPYRELIGEGALSAVMLSHVVYSKVSPMPATSSPEIVGDLLRGMLGFEGPVITDDLVMEGAGRGLDIVERTAGSAEAGCDLFLWCGGEPVLFDTDLSTLNASEPGSSGWSKLMRA